MKKALGLDLAGYSTGRSALVAATVENEGPPTVTVLTGSVFAQKVRDKNRFPGYSDEEATCLRRLLNEGEIFIDVPIDLQGLMSPQEARFVWELTRRPVDQAFRALCPLADRIGACVARIRNLRRRLETNGQADPLECRMFETYPAGSLKLAGKNYEEYKGGKARHNRQDKWQPSRDGNDKDSKLAALLNDCQWTTDNGIDGFTDDEFDAALCALTGVGKQLREQELADEINQRLVRDGYRRDYRAPQRYVLLKEIPPSVVIYRRSWE